MKYIKILTLVFILFSFGFSSPVQCVDDSDAISNMSMAAKRINYQEIILLVGFDLDFEEDLSEGRYNIRIDVDGVPYYFGAHESGDRIFKKLTIPDSPLVFGEEKILVECFTNVTGEWREDGCIVIVQPCC